MATYLELQALFSDSDLQDKIEAAVTIAAQTILDGDDSSDPPWDQTAGVHDLRVKWANSALQNTRGTALQILKYVLAANAANTVTQIQNATDAAIQANVNVAIDGLATAQYG